MIDGGIKLSVKIKQRIECSGKYKEPDLMDLLVPECIVCPECGNLICPKGDDKDRVHVSNIVNEHRYYDNHGKEARFRCIECGCIFTRTVHEYKYIHRHKLKCDILFYTIILSLVGFIVSGIIIYASGSVIGTILMLTFMLIGLIALFSIMFV